MDAEPKRTPLYSLYGEYGARTTVFAGWELPLQFSGIREEHTAVRERAGLFDVSHMGELELSGPRAETALQRLLTQDVARLPVGRATYALMCNERGGVVDDLIAYRLAPDRFLLVVNAANVEKDLAHVLRAVGGAAGVEVRDRSRDFGLLALQGPRAEGILGRLVGDPEPVRRLPSFGVLPGLEVAGVACTVARTGYTGEDGFELLCRWEDTPTLWERLLAAGKADGLVPCGLGARDTLRFEAGLPLYGHELGEDISPLEAGLERFVRFEKGDFIGRDALRAQRERGPERRLVGLEVLDRAIARSGHPVTDGEGRPVGVVTSGTFAPTLAKSLAMAFVPPAMAEPGRDLGVVVHGRRRPARVVPLPFYRRRRPAG